MSGTGTGSGRMTKFERDNLNALYHQAVGRVDAFRFAADQAFMQLGRCTAAGNTGACTQLKIIAQSLDGAAMNWMTTRMELESKIKDAGLQPATIEGEEGDQS